MGKTVSSLPKEEEEEEEPISYLSDRSRIGDFVQAGRILVLDRKTINSLNFHKLEKNNVSTENCALVLRS